MFQGVLKRPEDCPKSFFTNGVSSLMRGQRAEDTKSLQKLVINYLCYLVRNIAGSAQRPLEAHSLPFRELYCAGDTP